MRRLLDRAATLVSYEAYVRGSTDNICTMVISLADSDCCVCCVHSVVSPVFRFHVSTFHSILHQCLSIQNAHSLLPIPSQSGKNRTSLKAIKTGIQRYWPTSSNREDKRIISFQKRMFSRAFTQTSRVASSVVRNSSVKTVVKRHSHGHAGTPPPPYVQRKLPSKSVGIVGLKEVTGSFLSTPS